MAEFLGLEPAPFQRGNFIPHSTAEAVYREFVHACRVDLSAFLLSTDFDPAGIVPRFHETIDANQDQVLPAVIKEEQRHRYEPEMFLHAQLGALAIPPEAYNDVVLEDTFVSDLHNQVDDAPYDFKVIGEWHGKLAKTGILDLVATINEQHAADPDGNAWIRPAFELVRHAAENPEAFTIPAEDLESLYLVTFMPYPVRGLVRRMITGNIIMGQLRQEMGDGISEADEQALTALGRFYVADALSGQHWDDFLKKDETGSLEDISTAMAMLSSERMTVLGQLERLTSSGEAQRVAEAYVSVGERLNKLINHMSSAHEVGFWQRQDTGHCFEAFKDRDLYRALNLMEDSTWMLTFGETDKSGRKAIILEDDDVQREAFRQVVNENTPFVIDDASCFATPEEIQESLDDPEVGLFVLDIQNGEDKTAGIRIAEALVAAISQRQAEGSDDKPPKVKIILWSASSQAFREAQEYFEQRIDALSGGTMSRQGSDSFRSGLNTLILDVRLKRWSAVGDTY
jgi:hypothetical protein